MAQDTLRSTSAKSTGYLKALVLEILFLTCNINTRGTCTKLTIRIVFAGLNFRKLRTNPDKMGHECFFYRRLLLRGGQNDEELMRASSLMPAGISEFLSDVKKRGEDDDEIERLRRDEKSKRREDQSEPETIAADELADMDSNDDPVNAHEVLKRYSLQQCDLFWILKCTMQLARDARAA